MSSLLTVQSYENNDFNSDVLISIQFKGLGQGVSQHSLNQLNQSPHQSLNQSLNQSMNQSMEMIEPKNSQSQG